MAPFVRIEAIKPTPLSLAALCACPCRPFATNAPVLTRPLSKFNLGLLLHGPKSMVQMRLRVVPARRCVVTARGARRAGPGQREQRQSGSILSANERVVNNALLVVSGGWVITVALASAVSAGSREYFELVRSRGIAAGMTPPPRYVSQVCSVICALMPILIL
ncbi:phosphatidate cytidylyltransferase 5, chloroplastic-like [Eucalyptus grandis]|uniref:phosphatidate cytidylyltransferase 5, chloroplastic-like n=1 Tax=Eucalyptus grandis TaxID=71139 RepID=UPI00192EA1EB|nr:phosphatidate cytidylyltransferase 5, chloroplastic-like [Eucalyptus grandis]